MSVVLHERLQRVVRVDASRLNLVLPVAARAVYPLRMIPIKVLETGPRRQNGDG